MKTFYFNRSFFSFRVSFLFFVRRLVTVLFGPDTCLRCGKPSGVFPLCSRCLIGLFSIAPPLCSPRRCRICGKVLISEIGICSRCRSHPVLVHTDGVFPIHPYLLWKKQLLIRWKFDGCRLLSPVFALLVHEALGQLRTLIPHDCPVIPVPPRPGKIRKQGWDQIDELCHFLHCGYGTAVLPVLVRRESAEQKQLDRLHRLGTIGCSYALADNRQIKRYMPQIPDCAVLVDDVLTTGATIETCAGLLKQIGIKRVYAVTLCTVN